MAKRWTWGQMRKLFCMGHLSGFSEGSFFLRSTSGYYLTSVSFSSGSDIFRSMISSAILRCFQIYISMGLYSKIQLHIHRCFKTTSFLIFILGLPQNPSISWPCFATNSSLNIQRRRPFAEFHFFSLTAITNLLLFQLSPLQSHSSNKCWSEFLVPRANPKMEITYLIQDWIKHVYGEI